MTGPEHFLEAERLLNDAAEKMGGTWDDCGEDCLTAALRYVSTLLSAAQAHGTLALAAAVAEGEHCSNGWTGITAKRQPREAS